MKLSKEIGNMSASCRISFGRRPEDSTRCSKRFGCDDQSSIVLGLFNMKIRSIFLALWLTVVGAQEKYKLCDANVDKDTCLALQRGESKVSCLPVADSADCAIRLSRGEADFGIFNTEELLLAYQFYPKNIAPIYQLKHKDRLNEEYQFESVAVISSSITASGRANFSDLRDGGFCHPGFSAAQWWNDYILKYFERKVIGSECRDDVTIIENELERIKNFFGKACRPGEWATDISLDQSLRDKYPELCELCSDRSSCSYTNTDKHGHAGALECLTSGRGKVAYVALTYVREYLKSDSAYQFLCMDGTTQPLTTEKPCAWIKQPWDVIASRKAIAAELTTSLRSWLDDSVYTDTWTVALKTILQRGNNQAVPLAESISIAGYISTGREVDLPNAMSCNHNPIRWCTISDLETNKCNWIARATNALGIEPSISCKQSASTFQCFRDIANNKADVITIDSNYGYLARTVFGLGTLSYCETKSDENSVIVAVTQNTSSDSIKTFEDLRGRKACFPEYSGIAWLSFIHAIRSNGIVSPKYCDYSDVVAHFLQGACTPGVQDINHSNQTDAKIKPDVAAILCSSCPSDTTGVNCAADEKNVYYQDHGALKCLKDGHGDIAFVEKKNLRDIQVNGKEYRILCKNGTLANEPGFDVDDLCPLAITVDSEIVGRRNSSKIDTFNTMLAIEKIENWLGYKASVRRPIRIYGKFNNTANLLFKDSTAGLVNVSSMLQPVLKYKELFAHVETCSTASLSAIINIGLVTFALFMCFYNAMF